jgi:hypothetical protein
VINGRTKQLLTDTFLKLKQEALKAGLIITINKTKYLHCTRKSNQHNHLIAGDEWLEQVNSFKYLGTMVNTDNSIVEEIKERIAAGNRAYHVHKKLFISKLISRSIKLHFITLLFVQ